MIKELHHHLLLLPNMQSPRAYLTTKHAFLLRLLLKGGRGDAPSTCSFDLGFMSATRDSVWAWPRSLALSTCDQTVTDSCGTGSSSRGREVKRALHQQGITSTTWDSAARVDDPNRCISLRCKRRPRALILESQHLSFFPAQGHKPSRGRGTEIEFLTLGHISKGQHSPVTGPSLAPGQVNPAQKQMVKWSNPKFLTSPPPPYHMVPPRQSCRPHSSSSPPPAARILARAS